MRTAQRPCMAPSGGGGSVEENALLPNDGDRIRRLGRGLARLGEGRGDWVGAPTFCLSVRSLHGRSSPLTNRAAALRAGALQSIASGSSPLRSSSACAELTQTCDGRHATDDTHASCKQATARPVAGADQTQTPGNRRGHFSAAAPREETQPTGNKTTENPTECGINHLTRETKTTAGGTGRTASAWLASAVRLGGLNEDHIPPGTGWERPGGEPASRCSWVGGPQG
jgi:hypothetical protein